MSIFYLYSAITSHKKSEKFLESFLRKLRYQPTNQPINQPTNQLTNQPTNQPNNQPTKQPTNQTIIASNTDFMGPGWRRLEKVKFYLYANENKKIFYFLGVAIFTINVYPKSLCHQITSTWITNIWLRARTSWYWLFKWKQDV